MLQMNCQIFFLMKEVGPKRDWSPDICLQDGIPSQCTQINRVNPRYIICLKVVCLLYFSTVIYWAKSHLEKVNEIIVS